MEWISVKDRLPKDYEDVLIYSYQDGVGTGYFNSEDVLFYSEDGESFTCGSDGWWDNYPEERKDTISHWAPLPSSPSPKEWKQPTSTYP